ncbi:MAG: hypothetical protein WCO44_16280 [Bacteroidota bacterium]
MKRLMLLPVVLSFVFNSFSQNSSQNRCIVKDADINTSYKGGCLNGYANGHGIAKGRDTYDGNFKNGLESGQGTYVWDNGNKYIGNWVKGKADGKGTLLLNNGNEYNGNFKNGLRNGEGTFTWKEGAIYKGYWKNDTINGTGTKTYSNGDTYEGNFKNGNPNGPGTYVWANGVKYVGNFVDNEMMGQGIYYFTDGGKYVGSFGFVTCKPNQKGGFGVLYYPNGAVWAGMWICDKFDKGNQYPSRQRYSQECYIYAGTAQVLAGGHNFTGNKIKCGSDGVEKTIYFNEGWREDGWFSSRIPTAKDDDTWEIAAKKACNCR